MQFDVVQCRFDSISIVSIRRLIISSLTKVEIWYKTIQVRYQFVISSIVYLFL